MNYDVIDLCDRFIVIDIEGVGVRTYKNSILGREQLALDAEEYNLHPIYEDIIYQWRNEPIERDVITLDDLKADKQNELNDAFNRVVEGSFITDEGYKMQFNESDCNKFNGAIVLMENLNNTTGYLTDADDNTHFDISIDVMKSVLIQMLKKYAQCHLLKQQFRAVINEAESVEDLNKINIVFE